LIANVSGVRFGWPPQASQQQANHRRLYERFAGLRFALMVHHQPPLMERPGGSAFNDPPFPLTERRMQGMKFC
jgi:hypothetical protein